MPIVFVLLFIVTSISVHAETHTASSVEDVNRLCAAAKAGDWVMLKSGTYTDATIRFSNSNGTATQTITFAAEEPGKVFFEGNSTLSFTGSYFIVEGFTWRNGGKDLDTRSVIEIRGEHSTLQDCAIIDFNNDDLTVDNKWVSLYGQYNTLTRCLLKDKKNLGATVTVWLTNGQPAYHTISGNYFLNRVNGPGADNGLESIRIGDSKTSFTPAHCVVALNRFENCDGEIEIISNKSCHNAYLHNTFVNNNGGLTLRHGNDCLVDGNVFDGGSKDRSYGVRIIGEGHVVTNNYFYNLKGAPKEPFRAPLTVVNGLENTPLNGYFQVRRAVIGNNIFVNNNAPQIRLGARSSRAGMTIAPDTLSISGNVFLDEHCIGGELYEDISFASNLTFRDNAVYGKCLKVSKKGFDKYPTARRDGFDRLVDNKGVIIASSERQVIAPGRHGAGASFIDEAVSVVVSQTRYSFTNEKQVGPQWMR
jgi:poly(beta-D-mannuronate) lyase